MAAGGSRAAGASGGACCAQVSCAAPGRPRCPVRHRAGPRRLPPGAPREAGAAPRGGRGGRSLGGRLAGCAVPPRPGGGGRGGAVPRREAPRRPGAPSGARPRPSRPHGNVAAACSGRGYRALRVRVVRLGSGNCRLFSRLCGDPRVQNFPSPEIWKMPGMCQRGFFCPSWLLPSKIRRFWSIC